MSELRLRPDADVEDVRCCRAPSDDVELLAILLWIPLESPTPGDGKLLDVPARGGDGDDDD